MCTDFGAAGDFICIILATIAAYPSETLDERGIRFSAAEMEQAGLTPACFASQFIELS
jgi:hypothetical protein